MTLFANYWRSAERQTGQDRSIRSQLTQVPLASLLSLFYSNILCKDEGTVTNRLARPNVSYNSINLTK